MTGARNQWQEDSIVRHIEPTHAGHLELRRLSNFNIRLVPVPNQGVHVYEAEPKHDAPDVSEWLGVGTSPTRISSQASRDGSNPVVLGSAACRVLWSGVVWCRRRVPRAKCDVAVSACSALSPKGHGAVVRGGSCVVVNVVCVCLWRWLRCGCCGAAAPP